ncbi:MAG: hypothetical protein WCK53_08035 [Methanomicrobiales archaeon]
MTVTVGTLQKNVEVQYSALSPIEKARWFSQEVIDVGKCEARGGDITGREEAIKDFIKKYVNNLSDWDYACYFRELNNLDIKYWANAYFTAAINGFIREEALISMLVLYKTDKLVRDLIEWKKGKADYLREDIDTAKEHLAGYKTRRNEINAEIQATLEAPFWDTWSIPRPTGKPVFDQDYYNLIDDLEKDILEYEKRPAKPKPITRTRKIKKIDSIDPPVNTNAGPVQ